MLMNIIGITQFTESSCKIFVNRNTKINGVQNLPLKRSSNKAKPILKRL